LMPAPLHYSHRILQALSTDRKKGFLPQLGPDAKVQLSLQYENFKPVGVKAVVLSTQHQEGFSAADVREIVRPYVESVLPKGWMCDEDKFYVNPTGRFVIGGPVADSGLTGRKIIVDTYGSAAAHGGGAFSGKDPTKVDRSGAYIARYLAKNIVAAGLAERCTLQVAYGIGIAEPLSLFVDTHGTERCNCEALAAFIARTVDLTPKGIIDRLDLRRPIYKQTASYGHFGRTYEAETKAFPWERTDLAEILRCEINMPQNVKAYK
ncbi:MAG: methionine adenosyltransferase, partial [Alphaproteobacteria bacterium]|nr:methionine adenosyltransferase [Alphaproteobacteria bacterium]